jgi:hypothetical protein
MYLISFLLVPERWREDLVTRCRRVAWMGRGATWFALSASLALAIPAALGLVPSVRGLPGDTASCITKRIFSQQPRGWVGRTMWWHRGRTSNVAVLSVAKFASRRSGVGFSDLVTRQAAACQFHTTIIPFASTYSTYRLHHMQRSFTIVEHDRAEPKHTLTFLRRVQSAVSFT